MEKQRQETRPQKYKLRAPAFLCYSILILVPHGASIPLGHASVLIHFLLLLRSAREDLSGVAESSRHLLPHLVPNFSAALLLHKKYQG